MPSLVLFFVATTLIGFDDVMDLDDMVIEVPTIVGVATPLWPRVRMKLTLPKLGTWSPSGLPNL
jgi:hypothetical protein